MNNVLIEINKKTRQVFLTNSVIGNDGENLQENLVFSFNDEFVDGTGRLELIKPDKEKSYIMLEKIDETYQIPVKSIITKGGRLSMQLVITQGTDPNAIPIFKSNKFYVVVNSSINFLIEEPDEYPQWIDVANTKLNEIDEAIQEASNLDIDINKEDNVATITLTDKEGQTKEVQILDGQDGEQGPQGIQGETGPAGADGKDGIDGQDATINGVNAINIEAGDNITLEQEDDTLIINSTGGGAVSSVNGQTGDVVIDIPDVSNFITKEVNNLTYYELKTAVGNSIAMSIDSSTYVLTVSLKNSAGTILNTQTVDLPLETMVVGGSYDSTNKKIILTLKNGQTIEFSVADLVSGLQSEITSSNKLSADLVDDANTTNKFVSASEKTTWNNKYDKPIAGIPSTDLSSAVQTSLGKADTALQSETYTGTITGITMNGTSKGTSGIVDLGTVITDVSGKEDTTNKTTTIDAQSTNTQYPSAKAVYDLISAMGGGDFEFASYTATDSSPFVFAGKKGFYYYSGSSSISYFYYKMDDTSTVKQLYNNLPVYMIIFKDISKDTVAYDETIGYVFFKYARSSYDIIGYQELKYRSTTVALTEYIGNQYQIISSYNQTFYGTKTFGSFPITPSSAPTTNYQTANKKYVDDKPTTYTGYDATKTQVLKNVNGVLTWITEE